MTNITEKLLEKLYKEFKSFYPPVRFHYLQFSEDCVSEWVKGEKEPIDTAIMQRSVAEALGIEGGIDRDTDMITITYNGKSLTITNYKDGGRMQSDYTFREEKLR